MGTPNKLNIVFDELTVDVETTSEAERWEMIARVLNTYGFHLRYMQDFHPIRLQQLHMYIPESADSNHPTLGLRCLHLAGLDEQHQGPEYNDWKHNNNLFLTRDGKLLIVTQEMEMYWIDDPGMTGGKDSRWRCTSTPSS